MSTTAKRKSRTSTPASARGRRWRGRRSPVPGSPSCARCSQRRSMRRCAASAMVDWRPLFPNHYRGTQMYWRLTTPNLSSTTRRTYRQRRPPPSPSAEQSAPQNEFELIAAERDLARRFDVLEKCIASAKQRGQREGRTQRPNCRQCCAQTPHLFFSLWQRRLSAVDFRASRRATDDANPNADEAEQHLKTPRNYSKGEKPRAFFRATVFCFNFLKFCVVVPVGRRERQPVLGSEAAACGPRSHPAKR